jgi:hypothetical protein
MNASELTHRIESIREVRAADVRARVVGGLGPLTALGGIVWAIVQPYRLTLLHPHHQGFWWLVSEPPLFVVAVGLAFHLLIVPGLLRDLEDTARDESDI